MKKFLNFLFSMQMMGVLIILFAFSIGAATFIENDFGSVAARDLVYNAVWFELMLLLLTINLIVNIFRYQLYKKEKWSVFLFHVSFIVIIIGAGVTRYFSYEGNMHIREGQTTNKITTLDSYLDINIENNGQNLSSSSKIRLSAIKDAKYHKSFDLKNSSIDINLKGFIPNAETSLVPDVNGVPVMEIVAVGTNGMSGMQSFTLEYNSNHTAGNQIVYFGNKDIPNTVLIRYNDSLQIKSPVNIRELSMAGGDPVDMKVNEWQIISPKKLYEIGNTKLVIKNFYPSAKYKYRQSQNKNAPSVLIFNVNKGNNHKELIVQGGNNYVGKSSSVNIDDSKVSISYGSKIINLPFTIKLNDFQLDRYPGSNSPSSFASEVTLYDTRNGLEKDYRIYMNNILKHEGFRFYQASYDTDEKGTILSVNHDQWGMMITYFGYALLMLGMAWSIFNPNTRFKMLSRQSRKLKTLIVIAFLSIAGIHQSSAQNYKVVPLEQAKSFGEIIVQDKGGRFEPVNTLASELVRKITKKSNFNGYSAEQVLLSMIANPQEWQTVKLIKVGNGELAKELGINGKYATFMDFLTPQGQYKLNKKVQEAYAKKPAQRNGVDKEVISVDERVNVTYMVFTGEFLKIFPNPNNSMAKWFSPNARVTVSGDDSLFIKKSVIMLGQALNSNDFKSADSYITGIKQFQQKFGSKVMPSQTKQNVEILYNNINIFKSLFPVYLLVGFFLIIFLVTHLLKPKFPIKWIVRSSIVILAVSFALHTVGLAARWYISGHAPWSNGFESMTFVAWGCLLAGFVFVKKSDFSLAATAVLAGLALFVAHLSWMNPEVTNLVPVLKSYWLTIHVAIITSSYSFLALAALLGIINLILFNLQNKENRERLTGNVADLSRISEMTMTVGLYMLTIGTFLGGIWANESWGRYWGWDPKETWALVSILVYSFIIHMRYVPGLKSIYAFNLASVWGYSSILMTYFGVNYYLAGMHSYAKGDPVPVPTWVYYTVALMLLLSIISYFNYKKHKIEPNIQ